MATRATLRPWEMADVRELYEAIVESSAALRPWMPWCTPVYEEAATREFIERALSSRAAGTAYDFAILDESGRFAGGCGLNGVDAGNRTANLGYWTRTSHAGQGVAPAAVARLREWAFEHTDLNRLEILVAVGNAGSLRVAEKAGAVREGILRGKLFLRGVAHDAVCFSITRPGIARDFAVRLAARSDVSRLPAVERAAAARFETCPEQTGLTREALEKTLSVEEHHRARRAGRLWVAVDSENRPVGFAHVRELGGVAHLEELDVLPGHGRRGIGSALLEAVFGAARAAGHSAVTLSTFRDVPWNAPFYRRRGFHVVTPAERTEALEDLVATEKRLGLRTDLRVAMRCEVEAGTHG